MVHQLKSNNSLLEVTWVMFMMKKKSGPSCAFQFAVDCLLKSRTNTYRQLVIPETWQAIGLMCLTSFINELEILRCNDLVVYPFVILICSNYISGIEWGSLPWIIIYSKKMLYLLWTSKNSRAQLSLFILPTLPHSICLQSPEHGTCKNSYYP